MELQIFQGLKETSLGFLFSMLMLASTETLQRNFINSDAEKL